MTFTPPFALEVTDDHGSKHTVFVAHILSLKTRLGDSPGTIIRFANGTALNVTEGRHDLINKLDYPPPVSRDCPSV